LTNRLDRFLKLLPPSNRACSQFLHLQNASGKAFAAAVAESGENAQLNRDHVAQMRGEKLVKVIVT